MSQRTPRVGDIVHFYTGRGVGPLAAIIVGLPAADRVKLTVFNEDGGRYASGPVPFRPSAEDWISGGFWTWPLEID